MTLRADDIKANHGAIDGHVAALNAKVARFHALLDEGKSIVSGVAQSWEGEAWTSYKVQQDKWDRSATDINDVLRRINQALSQTNHDMAARDKANAAKFH